MYLHKCSSHTGFLSLDFACGICKDEFLVKFIIHFFDGFWTF